MPEMDELKFAVIGLGYVGLPLAVALARHWPVTGLDIDPGRVADLKRHVDHTREIDQEVLEASEKLAFTTDFADLADASVFIIAVPTPVTDDKYPDLAPLQAASASVGAILRPGALVIYESTVYPGATEHQCVPILESQSGLHYNQDFYCGYSPERVSPADRERRLENVVKVTSGSTSQAAERVDAIYRMIVPAGTHLAPSIKVAEAAKAIENSQRDVNIAFMNELARMFKQMDLDIHAVLAAASTKWNFQPFSPGLVGGHCIGVDPYYLIHQSRVHGYEPELITAARHINDGMAAYVVNDVIRLMAEKSMSIVGARVLVLGVAFKPDCPDLRNTQVVGIVRGLEKCQARVDVMDPLVVPQTCKDELGIELVEAPQTRYDLVLLAVPHEEYQSLTLEFLQDISADQHLHYDIGNHLPESANLERM